MMELFKLFGWKADKVIEEIKKGKDVVWDAKSVEGRTVLVASINDE